MITQVTEKETQLSHMLTGCTEALKAMTAERDALRDALETIAGTTDGTDCNEVARAALEKRND